MATTPPTVRTPPGDGAVDAVPEGRSARKRKAIMEAATTVFLRGGYLGSTMDEVAALAAVSKQTVYKHFASKERLFTDIVLGSVGQVDNLFRETIGALRDTGDLERDLTDLARRFVAFLLQPEVMKLRRLVIAEADRFPEVGRAFYEQGPERVATVLGGCFEHLAGRGMLRIDDPTLAAYHFCWLALSIPWNRVLFLGDGERFTEAELEHYADAGVQTFLAAHGRAS
jgi:TetR/AcrR family transcriptional repressor of mexJK operon